MVGGSVESVGRWLVDLIKPRKNMFGVVISPVHFVGGFFCHSNFIFFYIDNKEKANSIPRSSLFESLLELHQIFLIFIRSCS